ncbi:DNA methyltransferase [Methanogenium organophilum]|uniref:site-specific DNA-methyltransferase (cytosine-N(4)-specific) n=1 Tax=Methanogenium organophilum TaxID=2199 RepID=A0A9X9T9L8_METOG|nr:DNA methyltransferase [Methanogenium organophilum]WAI02232.1 DNA methyltransferase [Methanogenium organophilum]
MITDQNNFGLNPIEWSGYTQNQDCNIHQISPYIGKIKPAFAKKLVQTFSKPKDTILDPFSGSGTIPLESWILGRNVVSCDINPYAYTLTCAKLHPYKSLEEALEKTWDYLSSMKILSNNTSLSNIPDWVKDFYHPDTLKECIAFNTLLRTSNEYFIRANLLGIIHHQRPGFLSYPASHMVPYLRTKKFPKDQFPELYEYRDLESRIIKKIVRSYRKFPELDFSLNRACLLESAQKINLEDESIDAVITSPPYMNALDYARDNRLRLWFLGISQFKEIDQSNPRNIGEFKILMKDALSNLYPAIKKNGYFVFVVGNVKRTKHSYSTAQALVEVTDQIGNLEICDAVEDIVPDIRRVRKECNCTKKEWIVVIRKVR